MKKIIACSLLSLCLIGTLSSQNSNNDDVAAVKEGDNTINLYYGTNLLGGVYKRVASSTAVNLQVKSIGPVGLVYEHLLTDVIGLGFEFGYSQTKMDYEVTDYYYGGPNGQAVYETYSYKWKFTTIRAMVRANFHFANSEKFDAYGLVSAGYRGTSGSFTTSDPDGTASITYNSPIPIGLKPGLGLRYFFVPNVGINLEIALGTPLLCGGLSFKF